MENLIPNEMRDRNIVNVYSILVYALICRLLVSLAEKLPFRSFFYHLSETSAVRTKRFEAVRKHENVDRDQRNWSKVRTVNANGRNRGNC